MIQFLFAPQMLFIGSTELLLIGGIALLLFGGKKLPEMMRGLGQGVREFKKGMDDTKPETSDKETCDEEESTEERPQENCEDSTKTELKNND